MEGRAAAHTQARDYFHGLSDAELPKYLLVSDFARFRLYDLDTGEPPVEFPIKELWKHIRRLGFIAGYQPRKFKEEDPVNVEAAEIASKRHDTLNATKALKSEYPPTGLVQSPYYGFSSRPTPQIDTEKPR